MSMFLGHSQSYVPEDKLFPQWHKSCILQRHLLITGGILTVHLKNRILQCFRANEGLNEWKVPHFSINQTGATFNAP